MPFWVSSLAAFCRFWVDATRLIAALQSAHLLRSSIWDKPGVPNGARMCESAMHDQSHR